MVQSITSYLVKNLKSLNSSNALCHYYIPTVSQTPKALGSTGIALWAIGGIITLVLIVLGIKTIRNAVYYMHYNYRRHIFHINNMYLIMAVTTFIGTTIPRVHGICSAAKDIYMTVGMSNFMDLILRMYGGEKVMYEYLKFRHINMKRLPICICCRCCIPICDVKRQSVTILKWMVWQMKWSQIAYYFIRLIVSYSQEDVFGIIHRYEWEIYLNLLNVCSFMPGVISFILLAGLIREDLQPKYNIVSKGRLIRLTIVTTKFQRLFFEILRWSGAFTCDPPLVSTKFIKNVTKDFVYLIEVLVLGFLTFLEYSKRGIFDEYEPIGMPPEKIDQNGTNESPATVHRVTKKSHSLPIESEPTDIPYVITVVSNTLPKESVC